MKPYDNTDLPIEIKYDLEMMRLLLQARDLFGKYNAIIMYQCIPQHLLLKPFMFQESFKSCELSGNKISQSALYFAKYETNNDNYNEIINYYRVLANIEKYISPNFKLSVSYLNKIHRDILNTKLGIYRTPGKYRSKVSWIGRRGTSVYEAEYVPTHPIEISVAMANYVKHFNKSYSLDKFVDAAVSHAQFENIHPYNDGNGRLGRILIPIQVFTETNTHISLFLSEIIKENEFMYIKKLKDTRTGKWESYIKFFLELVIKQLDNNIKKLNEIRSIYEVDKEVSMSAMNKKWGEKVYHYLFSNITSTAKEASSILSIEYQTIRNYFNKLFDMGLLSKHKIHNGEYVYTYIKMYNVHIPIDWV